MVPGQPATVQQLYLPPLQNTILTPTPNIVSPLESAVAPAVLQPLPLVWPAITDLVVGKDGRYQQSDQIPEIQACLRAAVRRANADLAFLDAFPDTHRKGLWLAQALSVELGERRRGSMSIEAVDDRARHDERYFNRLLFMVTCFAGICDNATTANKPS